ncbi:dienelactone hydrolase family protein [Sporomusa sp. KB1]|uniref:dienelactone hydrolase family protein n=1 Tax=Sporomusa sp. KB1 TaxID=943346 RepID=UPI0011A20FDE|nr:dienelactone hydrolase family protein [Sporomusa sp. KB1]TWH45841.1 dienelactone hydrolase family protein [Sporomusa sp. KB1]
MSITEEIVHIPADTALLEGELRVPANAQGIVLFAHGSGSSRHSPRNNYVARILNNNELATLLMDLLTPEEDRNYDTRFDIELLTQRLIIATDWIRNKIQTQRLPIGYFGASTGAAAALQASAMQTSVGAVVSRGGRPDLAGDGLNRVIAPVLLLVGSHDFGVIELNEKAFNQLQSTKKLILVPGATHLFEEAGTLEQVANHAADWFKIYLASAKC